MDLYTKYYKSFYARAYRNPGNPMYQEAADLAHEMFDRNKNNRKKTEKQLLRIIDRISKLEQKLPRKLKRYAPEMRAAVLSGDYSCERPYQIRHRYQDSSETGYIYVLTAKSRPGECKLGATTMEMRNRCVKYKSKYGYPVETFYSNFLASPFTMEDRIKSKIYALRVAGNVTGDSIEWYRINPKELVTLIENECSIFQALKAAS